MEAKLAAFRSRRYESDAQGTKDIDIRTPRTQTDKSVKEEKVPDSHQKPSDPQVEVLPADLKEQQNNTTAERNWKSIAVQLLIWTLVWCLFINFGFGAVYFVLSIPVFIYKNLGRRSQNSPSAYSVFNPNCERIDGTFTAEQFEKELRYGAASVH